MVSFVKAACAVTANSRSAAVPAATAGRLARRRSRTGEDARPMRVRRPHSSIQREKLRGVAAEDCQFVCTRDLQCGDAGEHLLQASDLMRIVAAGEDVIGAAEVDGQPQRARVEVDRVVVELLQVRTGRAVDVYAALGE